jgi:hypothetical protein
MEEVEEEVTLLPDLFRRLSSVSAIALFAPFIDYLRPFGIFRCGKTTIKIARTSRKNNENPRSL